MSNILWWHKASFINSSCNDYRVQKRQDFSVRKNRITFQGRRMRGRGAIRFWPEKKQYLCLTFPASILTAEYFLFFCDLYLQFIAHINFWNKCLDLRLFSKYLCVPFLRLLKLFWILRLFDLGDLSNLRNGTRKYFENSLKLMHLFQRLMWAMNCR